MPHQQQERIKVGDHDYTGEEVALLVGEITSLKDENEKLRASCAEGHRQTAMWSAAASSLLRLLGKETLAQSNFILPDTSYIMKLKEGPDG